MISSVPEDLEVKDPLLTDVSQKSKDFLVGVEVTFQEWHMLDLPISKGADMIFVLHKESEAFEEAENLKVVGTTRGYESSWRQRSSTNK